MAKKEKIEEKSVEAIVKELEKKFGQGVVTLNQTIPGIEFISTGIKSIDIALGGGIPRGRIIELYGLESVGKSSLALQIIAEVQKNGELAAYVDVEHAYDPIYAEAIGVNNNQLIFSQPNSGEEALCIVEELTRTGQISIIVIDSVAALVPHKEQENNIGDNVIGLQARLMSQAMRVLNAPASTTKTALLFLNQIRQKCGIVYGNPNTTCGGLGLKFFASQRIELKKKEEIKEGDTSVAVNVLLKVVKNKCAPPFKTAGFIINFGEGIDKYIDIINLAVDKDIIHRGGAGWYTYKDIKLQGEVNLKEYLKEHPEVFEEIKNQL